LVTSVVSCAGEKAEPRWWEREHRQPILTGSALWFLRRDSSLTDRQTYLQELSKARAYEKLALADKLLEELRSKEECKTPDYTWKEGTNDLSRVAGRAKWGLEHLLGVQLPDVTPATSPQELDRLYERAELALAAYRNGIMALAADHPVSQVRLEQLRRMYKGKIDDKVAGKGDESRIAFDGFLGEWPPIGRKLEDLVSIIGPSSQPVAKGKSPAESVLSYDLTGEFGTTLYSIWARDGIIVSVTRQDGD
jgi:hypothetical protein